MPSFTIRKDIGNTVEFELFERLRPEIISRMLDHRLSWSGYKTGVSQWLASNCCGFYYHKTDQEVWFEREEDLIAFRLKWF